MSETHFCGALILAITFLLIIRYSLRKKNSFLNIREIVCDYWKMLSSLRHRVIFMATPISFGIGLTLISPISTSVLETVCTAISILLGLLFATLGAIASGNEKKKKGCNGVQREHNKKLNNGLPILHKVPPKRDYGRYFCIMAEKGGTSHGGLTEKLSPFFHAKKQEVNAYGR